jgi:hypothetical protein
LDERYRQEEFTKSGKAPRHRGCKSQADSKDVVFWHFQHADGTVITHEEQLKIQAESKKIWATQCEKGTIRSLWTTISPMQQLEFYLKMEAKFPLLRLCKDHYKAETIAFSDYSHWHGI